MNVWLITTSQLAEDTNFFPCKLLISHSDVAFSLSNARARKARQDEVVSKLLGGKRNGYFVDLAANDAVRISNTYALESKYDWRGLCIEANPTYWSSLSYRKCDVVGAVIGRREMDEVRFNFFPRRQPARGGIVGRGFDNNDGDGENGDGDDAIKPRYTVTLRRVFHKFNAPSVVDYLSLDVEGAESFILDNFPFDEYRFNLLTVERPNEQLSQLLERNGYVLLKSLKKKWGETLWAHRSVEASLNKSALSEIDTENFVYREKQRRKSKTA